MNDYRLTPDTEIDLQNIYEWGYVTFGEDSADKYHLGLLDRFSKLASSPLLCQTVDHICEGARRAVHGKNSIYYKIIDDDYNILIIGVLGQQDLSSRFSD